MSLITITDAQRYAIGYRCGIAANLTRRFVNDTRVVTAAQAAAIDTAIQSLMDALKAAGYSSVPDGSVIVAGGDAINVVNSNGTVTKAGSVNVTDGVVSVKFPATIGMKANGETIYVQNVNGASGIGSTAYVDTNGVLLAAQLPATAAVLQKNATIQIRNSAGTAIGNATFNVASGAITYGALPATIAGVTNGQALTGVAPTGKYTNTVTFTVAGGVITAITLS